MFSLPLILVLNWRVSLNCQTASDLLRKAESFKSFTLNSPASHTQLKQDCGQIMAWAEKAAFASYLSILVVPCWADRNSTLLSKHFLSSMSAWGDTERPRVCVKGRSRSPAALAGGGNFISHYGGAAGTGSSSTSPGLSWRKSCKWGSVKRHRTAGVPRWERGEPSAPDPAEGPMCSPRWLGNKTTQLWCGTLKACYHISLLPPHTWLFCALNGFVTPRMTPRVIQTGSLLRHGHSSFCHPDKSSVVLKPLEISLPRNEICLLLGCGVNINNCIGSGIIFVAFIYIMDACSKRSKEQTSKYLLFPAPAWCTLWIPDIDSVTCKL